MRLTYDNIDKICKLFLQYGIKSISMDDIANELGKSKKTLYQDIKDKNELVKVIINHIKDQMLSIVNEFENSEFNAIEKEVYYRKKNLKAFLNIKPTFLFDLRKFYGELYNEFLAFKKNLIIKTTEKFIVQGKKEGLFRQDIDPVFMSKISAGLLFTAYHPDIDTISEKELTDKNFAIQYFIYHMNGICTDKGRQLFYKLINEDEFLNK